MDGKSVVIAALRDWSHMRKTEPPPEKPSLELISVAASIPTTSAILVSDIVAALTR